MTLESKVLESWLVLGVTETVNLWNFIKSIIFELKVKMYKACSDGENIKTCDQSTYKLHVDIAVDDF